MNDLKNDDFDYELYYTTANDTYDNISSDEEDDDMLTLFDPIKPRVYMSNFQIGLIHFFLSSSFMILQFLVFSSFYNNKTIFKKTCFKIIFNHGILSLIQQICHIITSIITILEKEEINVVLPIIGAILTASYIGSTSFILLLTLNRFDIVYDINFLHNIEKEKFYLIGIVLCYIWTIVIFIGYSIIPACKLTFSFTSYEWIYLNSEEVFEFEKNFIFLMLGISFVLQFMVLLKILFLRCGTSRKIVFVPDDLKIVFHAFLCFATTFFLELLWEGLLFQSYFTGTFIIVPHLLYIFSSVSNSFFILCCVKEIRKNIIIYRYYKKKFKNSSPVKSIKLTFNTNGNKLINNVSILS
ncbi:7TM GPCR, serpentine receptor class x (Srx) family-containing protein [Strongyloides ratti]|uniref:7TM GPCR, serpentine receptor class x (Srx) family-containing protein n=1 Tax=Strongyloides ratti TaxID=34506 RepID=A0A090LA05_STRRB|nr:7TM GPCR, serpentine receptor class x (Srx) family-containing protein [Strongyloides ratti]CEF64973.1 7TM GPCR, serpentine receptor class x (Srx) family-containing protein [Strongyloides ratti]